MTNPMSNSSTEREKLIEELRNMNNPLAASGFILTTEERLADFILAERKRIVEPLVHLGQIKEQPLPRYETLCQAIEATINNAGIQ